MSERTSSAWERYFGFEDPYPNQARAVEDIVETARSGGYVAMEGPCGTGKTMAALTAAATLLRETSRFETLLVVTPVKQQRRQFVEDLRDINEGLDDPLDGVALVGKRDLCPYGREGVFPEGESVQSRCEDLRETTARLVSEESDLDPDREYVRAGGESRLPDDEQWWDPAKARFLVDAAQRDSGDSSPALQSAGRTAPYPRAQPSTTPEMAGSEQLYCPFEADWYARDKGSPVTFDADDRHVVTTEEFLPEAVEAGVCPHRAMAVLLEDADVVVGNYNHLFDAASRHLVEPLLDERTLVVVDEAHRLEERVRDLLTDTVGYATLKRARRDLGLLLESAGQSRENEERIEDHLAAHEVTLDDVRTARAFYREAMAWLESRVDAALRERFADGSAGVNWDALPDEDVEVGLRDPQEPEPDEFTRWVEEQGYGGDVLRALSVVGAAVEDALDAAGEDRDCVCTAVGALFGQWWERDHVDYFRELRLERAEGDRRNPEADWLNRYNASLVMYNCMPADEIGAILDELGGGVLMSATLEPLSVFEEVSGVASLTSGEDARAVRTRTYDLPFPEENRASWVVDVEAFTQRNRGAPTVDNRNRTRERYAYVARLVARSHGNVLLAWPNYREAEWAAARLREEVAKPVLLDRSSSHEETRGLKREFVGGGPKVLVTSTRGTLTEGVDYPGEQLHTCAVFGVPLVNVGSSRVQAVKRAYGEAFGAENAFEYALTVPAVRQVRQALGRVVRGPEERGVRVVVGKRFVPGARHSVHGYFPESERAEFLRMTPEFLEAKFAEFWGE